MSVLSRLLDALVIGLIDGTIYGLLGLGIVLIYKSQRILNFAQAEFATLGAFMLLFFHDKLRVPYGGAFVLAILTALVAAVVVERLVIQPLRDAPDVTVFVATAGVALLMIAVTFVIVGPNPTGVPSMFGDLENRVTSMSGVVRFLSPQRLLLVGALVATAGALATFFRRSALGRAILAMSAEPFAVRLAGIDPKRMSMFIWALSGALAGLAGALYSPTTSLTVGYYTSNSLIPAFTGVVIGGLTSMPGALAGGVLVGVITAVAAGFAPSTIPAPNMIATFAILLLTLTLRPQGLLAREA